MVKTASEIIGDWAANRAQEAVSDQTVESAARAFLDTYAVAIAGGGHEIRHSVDRFLERMGSDGPATDWVTGRRLRPDDAAFSNGVSGHVLDFDDVTSPLRGHPSIAMVPALVALSEDIGATGEEFAKAYEIGFEVICKLAKAAIESHYVMGWHSTSTMGMIGASVACATLLGLDEDRIVDTLGIAVAQAAGTRQNFGSFAKSFQAGNAGAAAIRSARFAEAGMSASPSALDGPLGGFIGLYTDATAEHLHAQLATLGADGGELASSGLEVKKYPLCYATHRALDGVLDVQQETPISLGDVERVEIRTNRGGLVPLIHDRPQTALEAKFSMQFAIAAVLATGTVRLSTFRDEFVTSPEIQSFLPNVTAVEADGPMFPRWTEIDIHQKNGSLITKRVELLRGSAVVPLTTEELTEKVADCFSFGGRDRDAVAFVAAARDWRAVPVSEIVASVS
jgi:2-methylcitrate dehydratase PrpD